MLHNAGEKVLVLKSEALRMFTQIDDIDSLESSNITYPYSGRLETGPIRTGLSRTRIRYPSKATDVEDIKSAAFLAQAATRTLCTPARVSTIISTIMNRLSEQVHDFNEECISHGGRTRIFNADDSTKAIDGWFA